MKKKRSDSNDISDFLHIHNCPSLQLYRGIPGDQSELMKKTCHSSWFRRSFTLKCFGGRLVTWRRVVKASLTRKILVTVRFLSHFNVTETFCFLNQQTVYQVNAAISLVKEKRISFNVQLAFTYVQTRN